MGEHALATGEAFCSLATSSSSDMNDAQNSSRRACTVSAARMRSSASSRLMLFRSSSVTACISKARSFEAARVSSPMSLARISSLVASTSCCKSDTCSVSASANIRSSCLSNSFVSTSSACSSTMRCFARSVKSSLADNLAGPLSSFRSNSLQCAGSSSYGFAPREIAGSLRSAAPLPQRESNSCLRASTLSDKSCRHRST
mmetsp:Transcript_32312/g.89255  ORF Transcript_32312/g.89255 Transcript_32312/m.89255 type:complete len:201 (+) Transcript_32312:807-1409(+)